MNKSDRIAALCWLGENLESLPGLEEAIIKAGLENPFFTEEFCQLSLRSVRKWMQKPVLESWLAELPETGTAKTAGLILAGNLPLVGWHDVLSVFASGHRSRIKFSSRDSILPQFLIRSLIQRFPAAESYFEWKDEMKGIDALIASGSNATARQFEYYFRFIPRLIRGAKSSLGLVYGFETASGLTLLCDDIMQYFGMGCRSITKLLVPENYDFSLFFESMEKYRYFSNHHRYQNNVIYHQAIFLMNGDPFLENNLLLVRRNDSLFSPPGVLNFQEYQTLDDAASIISRHKADLQCLVSHGGQFAGSIPWGMAQQPGIGDYADGVNTLEFLQKI